MGPVPGATSADLPRILIWISWPSPSRWLVAISARHRPLRRISPHRPGTPVSMQQVIAAVEQEYRKLGRLVLEREFGPFYSGLR